ncbi:MAG: phosphopeptide-binding protein, partial [Salinibacterium sp.]|nr:phosphopeptide-binding protein [Salinibacterium sp.]
PSVEPRYPGNDYIAPEVPKEIDPIPFPWLALAAPLIIVVIMFFVLENKTTLIFLGLAPLVMAGTFFTQVMTQKAKLKKSIEQFRKRLERLASALDTERIIEREVRNAEAPTTEFLVQNAENLGPALWSRRPEHWSFLNVRLGTGTVTSRNVIKSTEKFGGLEEFQILLDEKVEHYKTLDDVAIVESLPSAGCLGISGDPGPATAAANAVIAQIASLYSPAEVAIAAIVSPHRSRDFNWVKWLPHAGSPQSLISAIHLADNAVSGVTVLTALEELIEARAAVKTEGKRKKFVLGPIDPEKSIMGAAPDFTIGETDDFRPDAPVLVVLICDEAPLDRARVNAVVERSVRAGILPIWVSDTVAQLPAACRTFVDVASGAPAGATVGYVRVGMTFEGVSVSALGSAAAETFAKTLAAVSDASAIALDESDIPKSIALLSLLGHDMSELPDTVIDRWRQNDSMHDRSPGAKPTPRRAGKLRALVGQASVDAMHLDLRAQGPHALVGGTTGSGKSEFLQAWVLGMAAEYSPDRVTFLFVDYKGGSAFAECVQLPHCVGLVTDLTPHLVRRALTSLRAELHFREHLLNRKKAKDLIELEKRGDPECPPALVLVIDEFAALVSEIPEFVDGIVDIAQRGRSLGIHLIMATQRPAGVIKDNLRANTNLRIALRVADPSDSIDVVGSRIAADFDPSIPGRAVAKSGPARLVGFQTGYAGGWTRNEPATPSIEVADLEFGLPSVWQDSTPTLDAEIGQTGPNDTSRLVSTMIAAAERANLPLPRKPWLDELSPAYDGARLRQRTDAELVLGVVDDAKNQSQYPVYFRPDVD